VGFAGEQVALPARLAELDADGLVAGFAVDEQVDAVGAVLLPVEAAVRRGFASLGDRLVVAQALWPRSSAECFLASPADSSV
jgi:hypothetical protein